jgi:asparagine synthase (glutamine-hydrolysing)
MIADERKFSFNTFTNLNSNQSLHVLAESDNKGKIDVRERQLNAMESQALFDLQYYLQDDLLTKVDRASMHYSLETRVPYLDHRLVELSINTAPDLKYRKNTTKFILKEILFQYLPRHMFLRPKQGFAIPLNRWLLFELRFLIDSFLSDEVLKKHGIVRVDKVRELVNRFRAGENYLYNRIWLLIVLHYWLEKHHK